MSQIFFILNSKSKQRPEAVATWLKATMSYARLRTTRDTQFGYWMNSTVVAVEVAAADAGPTKQKITATVERHEDLHLVPLTALTTERLGRAQTADLGTRLRMACMAVRMQFNSAEPLTSQAARAVLAATAPRWLDACVAVIMSAKYPTAALLYVLDDGTALNYKRSTAPGEIRINGKQAWAELSIDARLTAAARWWPRDGIGLIWTDNAAGNTCITRARLMLAQRQSRPTDADLPWIECTALNGRVQTLAWPSTGQLLKELVALDQHWLDGNRLEVFILAESKPGRAMASAKKEQLKKEINVKSPNSNSRARKKAPRAIASPLAVVPEEDEEADRDAQHLQQPAAPAVAAAASVAPPPAPSPATAPPAAATTAASGHASTTTAAPAAAPAPPAARTATSAPAPQLCAAAPAASGGDVPFAESADWPGTPSGLSTDDIDTLLTGSVTGGVDQEMLQAAPPPSSPGGVKRKSVERSDA